MRNDEALHVELKIRWKQMRCSGADGQEVSASLRGTPYRALRHRR